MDRWGVFGLGPMEIIILLATAAIVLVPLWRILTRMGFSIEKRILLLLSFIVLPGFGLLMVLWVVALTPWPAVAQHGND